MRTRTTAAAALTAAVTLLALTACGTTPEPDAKAAPASPTASATSSSPAPEPTPQTTFTIGESADIDDTENGVNFTATVITYTQPAKGPQPPSPELGGDTWATAEVKVCHTSGPTITVSQFPWSLAYADGTRMEVTGLNGGDLPKPEFPTDDVSVKPGDCVRGKIPFPVTGDKRPERIVYAPASLTEPLEWTVPTE